MELTFRCQGKKGPERDCIVTNSPSLRAKLKDVGDEDDTEILDNGYKSKECNILTQREDLTQRRQCLILESGALS